MKAGQLVIGLAEAELALNDAVEFPAAIAAEIEGLSFITKLPQIPRGKC